MVRCARCSFADRLTRADSFNEHADCARVLLDAGASIDVADVEGSTALHRAAHSGDLACVKLLLERGADVHALDASQGTPVHNAAYAGRRDALVALLDAGGLVDGVDEAGNSPLHLAMHQSQVSRVFACNSVNLCAFAARLR